VGVFLSADSPDASAVPPPLDFSTPESLDYLVLFPQLKQVFFIGDGLTSLGVTQQVIVPAGATRLFLGTVDAFGWANNVGSFAVVVEPPISTNCFKASIRFSEVEVCWPSVSNALYRVDYRSDFTTNTWIPLTNVLGTGGEMCVPDRIARGQAQTFYRVVGQSQ
jgi:hypothetical protein